MAKSTVSKDQTILPSAPIQILLNEYERRKRKNTRYSLRSFSRDIGMNQSMLSLVLNGKRAFTSKQAVKVANCLPLSSLEKEKLIGVRLSVLPEERLLEKTLSDRGRKSKAQCVQVPVDFDLNWIEVTILELTQLKGFKSDIHWIASKLSISSLQALDAIENLESKGLLLFERSKNSIRITKKNRVIAFHSKKSQKYARQYHRDMIEKAVMNMEKTDQVSYERRQIESMTVSINPSRLEEAKKLMENFRHEMLDLLAEGDLTEVYQLNLQLFPLTQDI